MYNKEVNYSVVVATEMWNKKFGALSTIPDGFLEYLGSIQRNVMNSNRAQGELRSTQVISLALESWLMIQELTERMDRRDDRERLLKDR